MVGTAAVATVADKQTKVDKFIVVAEVMLG